jgi:hypothetical protein
VVGSLPGRRDGWSRRNLLSEGEKNNVLAYKKYCCEAEYFYYKKSLCIPGQALV